MYHCFFFFSIEMIISLRVLLFQTTVSLYSIVDIQNSSQCHRGANLNFLLAIIFYILSHIHEKNADTLSMHIAFFSFTIYHMNESILYSGMPLLIIQKRCEDMLRSGYSSNIVNFKEDDMLHLSSL